MVFATDFVCVLRNSAVEKSYQGKCNTHTSTLFALKKGLIAHAHGFHIFLLSHKLHHICQSINEIRLTLPLLQYTPVNPAAQLQE